MSIRVRILLLFVALLLAAWSKQESPVPAVSSIALSTPMLMAQSSPVVANAKGKEVYNGTCVVCHGAGIAGAPKFGDKTAWRARIAQGKETLYAHAIHGFSGKTGVMPSKGGNSSLTDADVEAAVDYMVAHGQ